MNPSFVIIDNLKESAGIYGNTTENLVILFFIYILFFLFFFCNIIIIFLYIYIFFFFQFKLFCHYLKVSNHPKAQQISKCAPQRLQMEWQTSKNKTDCGIFTMRHLEFYSGIEDKQWRSTFRENGSKNELATLRKLYAVKILLSDANKYKKDIIAESLKL